MESIAQIISAMMASSAPQVTQMSAPGSGGGGVNVPAMGKGASARAFANRGKQSAPQMSAELPEVATPFEGQVPTTGGVPLRPSEGGYQTATRPQDTTAPDNTPLIRQAFEAQQELKRYQNPQTITDAWDARKGALKKAEERFMQAQKNIQDYNAAQAAMKLKANVMQLEGMAEGIWGKERAAEVADLAYNNPDLIPKIYESMAETGEQKRIEGREDKQEELKGEQRFHLYSNGFNLDDNVASTLANNTDINPIEAYKLFLEVQEKGTELEQEQFKQRLAQTSAYGQVDNTIKQINNTLGHADNFGSTGLASVFYSKIPGTEAYNTLKSVDTQRAVNAFLELMNMRKASETGGALGNVSNREIELLYNAYTALDPLMGDAFQRNMVDVLQRFERVKYMLANEARFERDGATAEDMFNAATRHVNRQVAGKRGVPIEAIDDLMNDPNLAAQFEQAYGWSPISYTMDQDLSGLRGGPDYMR